MEEKKKAGRGRPLGSATAPTTRPEGQTIKHETYTEYVYYVPRVNRDGITRYHHTRKIIYNIPQADIDQKMKKNDKETIKHISKKEIIPALVNNYTLDEFNKIKPLLENKSILQFAN